jgi:hypothetical protein
VVAGVLVKKGLPVWKKKCKRDLAMIDLLYSTGRDI